MGREFELKFRANPAQLAAILADFEGFREIAMETTYYDTPDQALFPLHWTLRRRMENETSVCTLKTPCAEGDRSEWEVECPDITAAIPELCKAGAPEELKESYNASFEMMTEETMADTSVTNLIDLGLIVSYEDFLAY